MEAQGHDAWSCDLLAAPGKHIQGDVRTVLHRGWDLAVFHPPCTFLANSSSKHLYLGGKKENGLDHERWWGLYYGAEFFRELFECDIPMVACENPIMLGYAKQIIGAEHNQVIQPWMFGDPFQKATCLWLKNLPPLVPVYATWEDCRLSLGLPDGSKPKQEVHRMGPGEDRWAKRSMTYPGIANAFAEQWSYYARHVFKARDRGEGRR